MINYGLQTLCAKVYCTCVLLLVIGTTRARPSQQMEQAPSAPAPPPIQHQTLQQQQNGTQTQHGMIYHIRII